MRLRQLLPESRSVEVLALLGELERERRIPSWRPHVAANFVSSADGRAAVAGRSGGLGNAADKAMFHGLREHSDAVLAGTTTLREEGYGRILASAERRERRVARGLPGEPLACVLTRSGRLPEVPLFDEPEARVVVFTVAEARSGRWAADVAIHQVESEAALVTEAMRTLRVRYGVRSVLCEGGPTVFGALLAENVVDELFLTLAPKLAGGGEAPGITTGPGLDDPASLELRWLLEYENALLLRYGVRLS